MILAGIDAGGTATKCILYQAGQVLAETQAGPANYQVVGLESAINQIRTAIQQACQVAGVEKVDLLGIGLAGAGSEADRRILREALLPLENVAFCHLTDDGEIAVLGAHGGQPGLVTIAGTGSIVYGLHPDGSTIRRGGWGPLLGDEGSGFWIGLNGLKAIIKDAEKRGPETCLTKMITSHLNLKNLRQLVPLVYQERLPRTEIAALAPLVVEAMEAGDRVARRIIDQGMDELVLTVQTVYEEMENDQLETAVIGGLFNNPTVFNLFQRKLLDAGGYKTIRPKYSPVYGAAFYAANASGVKLELPAEVKEG